MQPPSHLFAGCGRGGCRSFLPARPLCARLLRRASAAPRRAALARVTSRLAVAGLQWLSATVTMMKRDHMW